MSDRTARRFDAAVSFLLFLGLWIFGSSLGPSDDEAYYWVLAQRLAPGYAFHPPAVAWLIRLAELVTHDGLGWSLNSVASLRFFSSFLAGVSFFLFVDAWRECARWSGESSPERRGTFALLAVLGGMWAAAWMMVPDLPLLFGLSLTWWSCHRLLSEPKSVTGRLALFSGILVAMLGKYSGVFVLASAVAVLASAENGAFRRRGHPYRAAIALAVAGGVIGFLPGFWWNATHEWAGYLYHLRDRHGSGGSGSWHPLRWLQFVGSQLVLVGPVVVFAGSTRLLRECGTAFRALRRGIPALLARPLSPMLVAAIFSAPPFFVYGLVPLRGDFKPHWMLVAWLPLALVLVPEWLSRDRASTPLRLQAAWGGAIGVLLALSMQLPLQALLARTLDRPAPNPLYDVSNDLSGWDELLDWRSALPEGARHPMVGARYQVSSQTAFALSEVDETTLLPRDLRQRDEWPSLGVTSSDDSEPLTIVRPFYFVADGRYSRLPAFKGGPCVPVHEIHGSRMGIPDLKLILIYLCSPEPGR